MADAPNFPHFHQHPLSFEDETKLDVADDVKIKDCSICGLLMSINPSYSCTTDNCEFSIHKQCAELPKEKEFHFNSTSHHLILVPKKSTEKKERRCSKCGQIIRNNFMYVSTNWGRYGKSYFHLFCVSLTELKTKHRSHEHPMAPTHKEISALCNACGENKQDHFLSCQACGYWIHKRCASLPSVGMHHSHPNHPLILLYSNPFSKQNPFWGKCGISICGQDIPIENAAYMCQDCSYFVQLKCVESDIRSLTKQESKEQIIALPPVEKDYELFPSILINNEVQRFKGDESSATATATIIKRMTPQECHSHESGVVCDACIRPISTPYYSCSTETGCHFLVHESCANLPKTIPIKFQHQGIHLFREWTSDFVRTFWCDICYRRCNGFGYSNDKEPNLASFVIDVECALAPRIIKHQSHNHFLHLMKWESFDSYPQFSCCTQWRPKRFLYMCISCDFKIHIRCALLPKKVSHEFDGHPLQLITNPKKSKDDDKDKNHGHLFCEFCEEDMDDKFWFYKCDQCDQSFHVDCIPSVGPLSKFKFGGTLDGVISCHPHHPLTSVSMLTIGNQMCGHCHHIIKGFTAERVAFQCSQCDFWIHWYCTS